tara:strand:+ start:202 stop:1329 length:1128 start_codon:yes stop_codon:yes gene_type:complete
MGKKNKKTNKEPKYNDFFKKFTSDVILYLCIGVILIGTLGLYMCKIAQSNILPDNFSYIPFDDIRIKLNEDDNCIQANILKQYDMHGFGWLFFQEPIKQVSESICFNNKQVINSYMNGLYGKAKKYSKNSNISLYFLHIFDIMFSTNNMIFNNVFKFMNDILPEWLILVIFPLVSYFFMIFLAIINFGISIFSHIVCAKDWFISKKDGSDDWQEYKDIKYCRLIPIIKFLVFLFFVSFPSIIIISFISFFSFIMTPFYVGYTKKGNDSTKIHTFVDFMKDIIVHKKQLILLILSLITLNNSSLYLGSSFTIGILISLCALIYYNIYSEKLPDDNSFTELFRINTDPIKIVSQEKFPNWFSIVNETRNKNMSKSKS